MCYKYLPFYLIRVFRDWARRTLSIRPTSLKKMASLLWSGSERETETNMAVRQPELRDVDKQMCRSLAPTSISFIAKNVVLE